MARPAMQHAGSAALEGGLVGASNAAADPEALRGGRSATVKKGRRDAMHLVWFDPQAVPRIRRKIEWQPILDALEQRPTSFEEDQAGLGDGPIEMEDRREVYEVVTQGTPSRETAVSDALQDAIRPDGRFMPQLLLLAGEMRFDFDELETVKATVATATPFVGADAELKAALDQATAFLATPGLVASSDLGRRMSTRVRDAFAKSPRPVDLAYFDEQVERALISRRAFQKADVFGAVSLKGVFFPEGSTTGIPTYFPVELGKRIPLFRRLPARLLAEAHFQADQYESHPAALRAAALARLVALGPAR